eukprot:m.9299 g.9299  ORF g.9299 m.9299 type:complete len:175 (-) comp3426_c0_seq1:103-627(-)
MMHPTLVAVAIAVCCICCIGYGVLGGVVVDNDDAVLALLHGAGNCTYVRENNICTGAHAFLCPVSCNQAGVDVCQDQDDFVAEVWLNPSMSDTYGAVENMNCARTRKALYCRKEPFQSLCPTTCLKCVDGSIAERNLYFPVLAEEEAMVLYECALQRKDADYACGSFTPQCPEF